MYWPLHSLHSPFLSKLSIIENFTTSIHPFSTRHLPNSAGICPRWSRAMAGYTWTSCQVIAGHFNAFVKFMNGKIQKHLAFQALTRASWPSWTVLTMGEGFIWRGDNELNGHSARQRRPMEGSKVSSIYRRVSRRKPLSKGTSFIRPWKAKYVLLKRQLNSSVCASHHVLGKPSFATYQATTIQFPVVASLLGVDCRKDDSDNVQRHPGWKTATELPWPQTETDGSSFSLTGQQDIKGGSGFRTTLWMSLSGPVRSQTWFRRDLSMATHRRFLSNLMEIEKWWCARLVQLSLKRPWRCNCCQRRINKVSLFLVHLHKIQATFYTWLLQLANRI